uniref:F-box domain-containing protein n=1 Tax=Panagrolaimus superbus TaxID=310955 RepID=A0A914Y295_9BILA
MNFLNQLSNFLNQCCPSYRKVVIELIEKLDALDDVKERNERTMLLEDFSDNFIMPTSLWRELIRIKSNMRFDERDALKVKVRQHFYFDGLADPEIGINIYSSLLKPGTETFDHLRFKDFTKDAINENLTYPRSILNTLSEYYSAYSYSPIPQEYLSNIVHLTKLYKDSKDFYSNKEKVILSDFIKSTKFISDNFIPKISMNIFDKNLWKQYIACMKKCDPVKSLEIYASFCRFFLDDIGMQNEYKNEAKIYGPSNVIWKNCFEWEKPISKATNKKITTLKWDPNHLRQNPLPNTLMYYIFSKCDPLMRHKFHSICKSFFYQFPYQICHQLECDEQRKERSFQEMSLVTNPKDFETLNLSNLYISNSLFVKARGRNFISKCLIPTIYRCNAKYIEIAQQILTWRELLRIIGHGNVEVLHLKNVRLNSDTPIYLEDLMAQLPNIIRFRADCVHYNPQTITNLLQLNFTHKFKSFNIYNITDDIQVRQLLAFIEEKCVSIRKVRLGCSHQMSRENYISFCNIFGENVIRSLYG